MAIAYNYRRCVTYKYSDKFPDPVSAKYRCSNFLKSIYIWNISDIWIGNSIVIKLLSIYRK